MTKTNNPLPSELREKLEEILMSVCHTGSMTQAGKTINPSMFSEDAEEVMRLFEQEYQRRIKAEGYIKPESLEYHRQEMMQYKANLPSQVEQLIGARKPGSIASMYYYHKSMVEQLEAHNLKQLSGGEK